MKRELSIAAVVGIGGAIALGVAAVALLGWWIYEKVRKNKKRKRKFVIENDSLETATVHIGDMEENYLKLLSNISESNKHLATTTKKHQVLFDKQWPHLTKYLFNIDEDPEEKENLAQKMPGVLEKLRLKARKLYSSFVPRDFNGTWPC